ncbi:hypothetical protein BROUX41_001235 [Berkeleyomyces rouxiae]
MPAAAHARSLTNVIRGVSANLLRLATCAVIFPVLLYGASVWFHGPQKFLAKARAIIPAYGSTPTRPCSEKQAFSPQASCWTAAAVRPPELPRTPPVTRILPLVYLPQKPPEPKDARRIRAAKPRITQTPSCDLQVLSEHKGTSRVACDLNSPDLLPLTLTEPSTTFPFTSLEPALRQIELSHDDIDRIPNTAKFRIMDEVLNTTKRRLQEYAQNCESYTEMMSVLRHQTVGTIQDPTAQVQRQLSNFEFLLGETLSELLDRYDDLMTGAQVTGLGLEERSKITHVMSAVGKHYESLETLI